MFLTFFWVSIDKNLIATHTSVQKIKQSLRDCCYFTLDQVSSEHISVPTSRCLEHQTLKLLSYVCSKLQEVGSKNITYWECLPERSCQTKICPRQLLQQQLPSSVVKPEKDRRQE